MFGLFVGASIESRSGAKIAEKSVDGKSVGRYDNEPGKADFKHIGDDETPCVFTTPEALLVFIRAPINQAFYRHCMQIFFKWNDIVARIEKHPAYKFFTEMRL